MMKYYCVKNKDEPDNENGIFPRYGFSIIRIADHAGIGVIYFCVDTSRRQFMRGHIRYGVSPAYSGRNYAAEACILIKRVAFAHGFTRLYIGSKRENITSVKTIEK